MAALDEVRARLAAGDTVTVRMRGEALHPLVVDGDVLDLTPCDTGIAAPGDLVVATIDHQARLRVVIVCEPGGARVLLGALTGSAVRWSDPHSVTGRVVAVNGRRWRHPTIRRTQRRFSGASTTPTTGR